MTKGRSGVVPELLPQAWRARSFSFNIRSAVSSTWGRSTNVVRVPVSELAEGAYVLRVVQNDSSFTERFVVSR